jgi:hypothetical protein
MKRLARPMSGLILGVLALAACATPREAGLTPPGVGELTPGLDLPTAGGGSWSLAAATERGPAVVFFYRGTF